MMYHCGLMVECPKSKITEVRKIKGNKRIQYKCQKCQQRKINEKIEKLRTKHQKQKSAIFSPLMLELKYLNKRENKY